MPTVTVYYSENSGQIDQTMKGKRYMGWSPGETSLKLPGVPSQWIYTEICLNFPRNNVLTTHVEHCQQRKLTLALVARDSGAVSHTGMWLTSSTQTLAPFPIPKPTWAFSINYKLTWHTKTNWTGRIFQHTEIISQELVKGWFWRQYFL